MTDTKTVVLPTGVEVSVPEAKPVGRPFQPGGDPRRQVGRVKGSKNKVTLLRLELEEDLREILQKRGRKVLLKALDMAEQGNDKVIKVLLDKMLASPKGDDPDNAKDTEVKITIQNLTHGEQKTAVAVATPSAVVKSTENKP